MQINPANDIVILLVEDNLADQKLILKAFSKGKVKTRIPVVNDGHYAIEYLTGQGVFSDRTKHPFPDLVLLDINLPRKDGKKVLKEIRSTPHLRKLPVIIFTTSVRDQDVIEAYELGVNAYMQKPINITDLFEAIQKLEDFWLTATILPLKS